MNSRETILQLLRDGHTVSGGELSRRLGLSRSAIWKVVSGLRRDGYDIEAAPGRGYPKCGAYSPPSGSSEAPLSAWTKPRPPTVTVSVWPRKAEAMAPLSSPTARRPDADA